MALTFDERAAKLARHPDTITITLGDDEHKWFLGKVTFDLARGRGLDLGTVLGAFDGLDAESGAAALSPMLDAFGRLLFFGMLPFDESLDEGDVTGLLSVSDMTRILPQLMGAINADGAADGAQGNAEAAAQGARDRKKGRR